MTIFALSSGQGRAGVSVIRVSGPETKQAILSLTNGKNIPGPRRAALRWFYDPDKNEKLDQGLLLWFPSPDSFTGEDVAEFHIHGGYAVVTGFLDALSRLPNLRSAEPGEFSRRAFDNGKMDLTSVEGLVDLINSETESQRRQALRQMDGKLADIYEGWRQEIITAMAYLEADIDFSEEEIPEDVTQRVRPIIEKLFSEIRSHLEDSNRGERLRDGLQVVILGSPNAGKSSLLNYLSKRETAIVSDIAGTTRDLLEVHLDIGGFPVTVVDTAGLRNSDDTVEKEGIRRAESRAENADFKIVLIDRSSDAPLQRHLMKHIDQNTMVLWNKCDLVDRDADVDKNLDSLGEWIVSVKTEAGIDGFMEAFRGEVEKRMELTAAPSLTRTRHRANLQSSIRHLDRFLSSGDLELELLSEDLRMAARDLGRITGFVDVEEILEKIFKEFCVGK